MPRHYALPLAMPRQDALPGRVGYSQYGMHGMVWYVRPVGYVPPGCLSREGRVLPVGYAPPLCLAWYGMPRLDALPGRDASPDRVLCLTARYAPPGCLAREGMVLPVWYARYGMVRLVGYVPPGCLAREGMVLPVGYAPPLCLVWYAPPGCLAWYGCLAR